MSQVSDYVNRVLDGIEKKPGMYGSHMETIEFTYLSLLSVWVVDNLEDEPSSQVMPRWRQYIHLEANADTAFPMWKVLFTKGGDVHTLVRLLATLRRDLQSLLTVNVQYPCNEMRLEGMFEGRDTYMCTLPRNHPGPHKFQPHDCPDCGVLHGVCRHCGTTHGDTHSDGCKHSRKSR